MLNNMKRKRHCKPGYPKGQAPGIEINMILKHFRTCEKEEMYSGSANVGLECGRETLNF